MHTAGRIEILITYENVGKEKLNMYIRNYLSLEFLSILEIEGVKIYFGILFNSATSLDVTVIVVKEEAPYFVSYSL